MRKEKIFVPHIAASTNSIYAGKHWMFRRDQKDNILKAMMGIKLKPFKNMVKITCYPVETERKRFKDSSNYSFTGKMIEDCLVKKRILVDDNRKYVFSNTYTIPQLGDKLGVWVIIEEVDRDEMEALLRSVASERIKNHSD